MGGRGLFSWAVEVGAGMPQGMNLGTGLLHLPRGMGEHKQARAQNLPSPQRRSASQGYSLCEIAESRPLLIEPEAVQACRVPGREGSGAQTRLVGRLLSE